MKNYGKHETRELTDYEFYVFLPIILEVLKDRQGHQNVISGRQIINYVNNSTDADMAPEDFFGVRISEAVLRVIINYIRTNDLIPGLVATSEGYFIAETEEELLAYERSLKGREDAIRQVRLSIAKQRRRLF